MQVILKPLTRQVLSEEEFYALGEQTPVVTFARLRELLRRLMTGRAQRRSLSKKSRVVQDGGEVPPVMT